MPPRNTGRSQSYQEEAPLVVAPPTDGEGHTDAQVRKLKPGQALLSMTGTAAKIGIVKEVWLPPRFLHMSERGNVLIDFRVPVFRADTPGVRVKEYDDGRVEVSYEDARIALRRKGWLRIDPILLELGIDPEDFVRLPEDARVEMLEVLKSGEVWAAVAEHNDVSWNEEYLATVPHASAAELGRHLREIAEKEHAPLAKAARLKMAEWVEVIRSADKGV